jgi:nicotinate dehydrogenase subunit A
MGKDFEISVNGGRLRTNAGADTPLLYVLRNDFGLNGPQFGCGLGQCGACTVLIDGRPVRSCSYPVSGVGTSSVTTLEGLGSVTDPHPLQKAFIDEQAAQCGVCSNGMIMTAAALLSNNPDPSEQEIRQALDGNLCRCGSHVRIVRAVRRAAFTMRMEG